MSAPAHLLRRLPQRCFLCQRACARPGPLRSSSNHHKSPASSSSSRPSSTATAPPASPSPGGARVPTMEQVHAHYRRKNQTVMNYALSIVLGTVALSYGSVPMYKMICQTTGWGGQPVRAPSSYSSADPDSPSPPGLDLGRVTPATDARRIRVRFQASVSDMLPWRFVPQQREVRVLPGETALAFYTAANRSDTDIIGVATYSVTPAQVAPYFSKIQCFCFEEQRLAAGETVDMPVFFYLDPDMLKDPNLRGIESVTLNYTFFKARYDNNGRFTSPLSDGR